ncbi:hypothetical protein C1I98_33265 [Spongiactinospora gelatinilytica]|uniref:Uncharacterized protein n=1 Tax=Spongiactinospora gelatinilytica TaxID=2666298 RepID=A0A2W2ESV1_9ACTN|nr:hypothetical protein C1I98_33265 [Spongiactinospora gelatinilytica]
MAGRLAQAIIATVHGIMATVRMTRSFTVTLAPGSTARATMITVAASEVMASAASAARCAERRPILRMVSE